MFGAGVDGPLGEMVAAIRSLVAGFETDDLAAHDAARVVEQCAEGERLLAALRVLAAASGARSWAWAPSR